VFVSCFCHPISLEDRFACFQHRQGTVMVLYDVALGVGVGGWHGKGEKGVTILFALDTVNNLFQGTHSHMIVHLYCSYKDIYWCSFKKYI